MMRCAHVATLVGMLVSMAATTAAQTTPPAAKAPDDTPSVRLGATLFLDYTVTTEPKITDADGNTVTGSAFNVGRAYLNVTGQINHRIGFRVTPDIVRETGVGSSSNGSLTYRLKYAYAQFNMDDWMTRGSWARLGMQPTAYVDFMEGIYRYRFQGTVFEERDGFLSSSDVGATFHYNFDGNYGDVHGGFYNGENYNRAEVNDQKGLMVRATGRPFARSKPVLRGLRASIFYVGDSYVKDSERKRTVGAITYEHPWVVAGFEYLDARDQRSALPGMASMNGSGYSVWVIPRTSKGWEGLIRYDHLTPNTSTALAPFATSGNLTTTLDSQQQNRVIAGVAYWFKLQGSVTASLLVDYDAQLFENLTATPAKTVAVHALVNF